MIVEYQTRRELRRVMAQTESGSLDAIVLAAGEEDAASLEECVRVLRPGGLLFVQGTPQSLPEVGVFLDARLRFKYWIAIESEKCGNLGLPSVHAGVLLFAKEGKGFKITPMRSPHQFCASCGRSLRDWGGKTHLMHPQGFALSDVWMHLSPADNYSRLSRPTLDAVLGMIPEDSRGLICLEGRISAREPAPVPHPRTNEIDPGLVDVIHCGDALEILDKYPDNSVDLVFADPPYNLNKDYGSYEDGTEEQHYIEWCNAWLSEYARILKPTGSLYALNLPRWAMHQAAFLNQRLHFQNWIVWNALSEPRGKLMPAHYGLLFYTKHAANFTFNYDEVGGLDSRHYCLRAGCIRDRKKSGEDDKETLTDIWWDIHRIRHKKDRDWHPCQLPDALMERIIRLSSNPGDIVLDALCGAGTTPVIAAKLGRRYVGIDIDPDYVAITEEKLRSIRESGSVIRGSTTKTKLAISKKELQLELRSIASELGRLPTPDDIERMSAYGLDAFLSTFPTWSKALKAAKLEVP